MDAPARWCAQVVRDADREGQMRSKRDCKGAVDILREIRGRWNVRMHRTSILEVSHLRRIMYFGRVPRDVAWSRSAFDGRCPHLPGEGRRGTATRTADDRPQRAGHIGLQVGADVVSAGRRADPLTYTPGASRARLGGRVPRHRWLRRIISEGARPHPICFPIGWNLLPLGLQRPHAHHRESGR